MADRVEIRVPDIGDFTNVDVIDVLVNVGDQVAAEDGLITLETDKAAMDVPAPVAGTVVELKISQGDKVSEGDVIAIVEARDAPSATAETKQAEPASEPVAAPPPEPTPAASTPPPQAAGQATTPGRLPPIDEQTFAQAHASPGVRKFARELGVDLARVNGSGTGQRITKDDIKAYVKSVLTGVAEMPVGGAALPKVPIIDFSKFGDIEVRPLTRIQKIAGPRLQASWVNLPHVTQHDEADITDLEARRKVLKVQVAEKNIKLTPLAFIIKACAQTLNEYPQCNASLDPDGEHLVYKKYCHVGFAVDTDDGLVVPVLRDADTKDVYEIAQGLQELSSRAREGKLKVADIQGGSFTVSSLGSIGGTFFTPIINAPEVAILGVSRAQARPVFIDGKFKARLVLPLSLSYDHRVIDGALAVRFTTFLCKLLGDADGLTEGLA